MLLPSGDQAGDQPPLRRSLRSREPFAFIVQMCGKPPRRLVKAIFDPSGDHDGSVSSQLLEVSWRKPVPSG